MLFLFQQVFQHLKILIFCYRVVEMHHSAILVVLCVVGGYSVNNSTYDVYVMLIFAAIGYIMSRVHMNTTPLLLGIILGPMAEQNLRRCLTLSKGSLSIFVKRPVSCVFLIITVLCIFLPITMNILRTFKKETKVDFIPDESAE